MKWMLFVVALIAVLHMNGQGILVFDDFVDGDLALDPVWTGDTAHFLLLGDWLRSDGPSASSTLSVSTNWTPGNELEWEVLLALGFNPSSTNYVRFYLWANSRDLEQAQQAYYIQLGESSASQDTIDVWKTDDGLKTKIFSASLPCAVFSDSNTARIRIIKDSTAHWTLLADCEGVGVLQEMGGFSESDFDPVPDSGDSAWVGLQCRYTTSSRRDRYWFDYLYAGPVRHDTLPPQIETADMISLQEVLLTFNEALDTATALVNANFQMSHGIGPPDTVKFESADHSTLKLIYSAGLPNADTLVLGVHGLSDPAGNEMPLAEYALFRYDPPRDGLLITEFLYDETPSAGLPESEFVELYNPGPWPVELHDWTLKDGSASDGSLLPPYVLDSGQYLICCPESSVAQFEVFGSVLGLENWPSLNNSGDAIRLLDEKGSAIVSLNYDESWHDDDLKQDGGWSLERVDLNAGNYSKCNWRSAIATQGGTPGMPNSVHDLPSDSIEPFPLQVMPVSADSILLLFSESMDSASLLDTVIYSLVIDSSGSPELSIVKAVPLPAEMALASGVVNAADMEVVLLQPSKPLQVKTWYKLTVVGARDCSGNKILGETPLYFGLPEAVDSLDLVINEMLYDAWPGSADFIELYNRSDKVINLGGMEVLEEDPIQKSAILDSAMVSDQMVLARPGAYILLSSDPYAVLNQYQNAPDAVVIEVPDMPVWPDTDNEGVVSIRSNAEVVNSNGNGAQRTFVMDRLHFSEDWHFGLLAETEGVSLERLSALTPTQNESNWHSAASADGFATPGRKNSQTVTPAVSGADHFWLDRNRFSPDQDGFEDLLHINYQFEAPGYALQLFVFNDAGRLITHLVNNQSIGAEGFFSWDGLDSDGNLSPIGRYLVYVEAFNDEGELIRHKMPCLLAGHLNH